MKYYFKKYKSLFLILLILSGQALSNDSSIHSITPDRLSQYCTLIDENYITTYARLTDLPNYQYPYNYLPSLLALQGKESIKLFVYGSLMDYKSASRTLSENTLKTREPAKAYGVKTIYNRSVSYSSTPHWGEPTNIYAIAMLNTLVTKDANDVAFGIVLDIPLDEIASLLSREVGYDMKPVVIKNINNSNMTSETSTSSDQHKKNYDIAYVLSSAEHSQYTDDRLLPREGYYQRVMKAAKSNGSVFFDQWLNHTFLSNGITTIGYYDLDKEKVARELNLE